VKSLHECTDEKDSDSEVVVSGNKGTESDDESWINREGGHVLSEGSSEEDVGMPLQISKQSKALNSLLDSLGLPLVKIPEEDSSSILKLIEIKHQALKESLETLEKQLFEKNKTIDQMKQKFEDSLGEALQEVSVKNSKLKQKSEELKKLKQKYVKNQHDRTHDVEKMA